MLIHQYPAVQMYSKLKFVDMVEERIRHCLEINYGVLTLNHRPDTRH
jgi:hypothetical protein